MDNLDDEDQRELESLLYNHVNYVENEESKNPSAATLPISNPRYFTRYYQKTVKKGGPQLDSYLKLIRTREQHEIITKATENPELYNSLSLADQAKVDEIIIRRREERLRERRQRKLKNAPNLKRKAEKKLRREAKKWARQQQLQQQREAATAAIPANPQTEVNHTIFLSDSDPDEVVHIEEKRETIVVSSDDEGTSGIPKKYFIKKEKVSNEDLPSSSAGPSYANEVTFVGIQGAPKEDNSLANNVDLMKPPSETSSISTDLRNKTTKKVNSVSSTPESNDFLDSVSLNAPFNYGLHGTDFNEARKNSNRAKDSINEVYETESSCSASDFAALSKKSAYPEVDFGSKHLFLEENLDSFSQFITPKRNSVTSLFAPSTSEQLVSAGKSGDEPKVSKSVSDSSSESEYEVSKSGSKQTLPNLSHFEKASTSRQTAADENASAKKKKKAQKREKKKSKSESELDNQQQSDGTNGSQKRKKKRKNNSESIGNNSSDSEANISSKKKAKKKNKNEENLNVEQLVESAIQESAKKRKSKGKSQQNDNTVDDLSESAGRTEVEKSATTADHNLSHNCNESSSQKRKSSVFSENPDAKKTKLDFLSLVEENATTSKAVSNYGELDEQLYRENTFVDLCGQENEIATDDLSIGAVCPVASIEGVTTDHFPDLSLGNKVPKWMCKELDHEEIINTMPDNPRDWRISHLDRNTFVKKREKRCGRCLEFGHTMYQCNAVLKVLCILCGKTGHKDRNCKSAMCMKCGQRTPNYLESCAQCTKNLRHPCKFCQSRSHRDLFCPDVWRRYHLTKNPAGPLVRSEANIAKPERERWCSGCASRGHFENACKASGKQRSQINPLVQSYKDVYNLSKKSNASNTNNRTGEPSEDQISEQQSETFEVESDALLKNSVPEVVHQKVETVFNIPIEVFYLLSTAEGSKLMQMLSADYQFTYRLANEGDPHILMHGFPTDLHHAKQSLQELLANYTKSECVFILSHRGLSVLNDKNGTKFLESLRTTWQVHCEADGKGSPKTMHIIGLPLNVFCAKHKIQLFIKQQASNQLPPNDETGIITSIIHLHSKFILYFKRMKKEKDAYMKKLRQLYKIEVMPNVNIVVLRGPKAIVDTVRKLLEPQVRGNMSPVGKIGGVIENLLDSVNLYDSNNLEDLLSTADGGPYYLTLNTIVLGKYGHGKGLALYNVLKENAAGLKEVFAIKSDLLDKLKEALDYFMNQRRSMNQYAELIRNLKGGPVIETPNLPIKGETVESEDPIQEIVDESSKVVNADSKDKENEEVVAILPEETKPVVNLVETVETPVAVTNLKKESINVEEAINIPEEPELYAREEDSAAFNPNTLHLSKIQIDFLKNVPEGIDFLKSLQENIDVTLKDDTLMFSGCPLMTREAMKDTKFYLRIFHCPFPNKPSHICNFIINHLASVTYYYYTTSCSELFEEAQQLEWQNRDPSEVYKKLHGLLFAKYEYLQGQKHVEKLMDSWRTLSMKDDKFELTIREFREIKTAAFYLFCPYRIDINYRFIISLITPRPSKNVEFTRQNLKHKLTLARRHCVGEKKELELRQVNLFESCLVDPDRDHKYAICISDFLIDNFSHLFRTNS